MSNEGVAQPAGVGGIITTCVVAGSVRTSARPLRPCDPGRCSFLCQSPSRPRNLRLVLLDWACLFSRPLFTCAGVTLWSCVHGQLVDRLPMEMDWGSGSVFVQVRQVQCIVVFADMLWWSCARAGTWARRVACSQVAAAAAVVMLGLLCLALATCTAAAEVIARAASRVQPTNRVL